MSLLIKDVLLETGYKYDRETVIATMTETKDILIEEGFFTKIEAEIEIEPEMTVIDARGQLLLPAFKEMHTHLDKTYFGGDWRAVKATPNGIFSRMEEEASLLPEQYATLEERAHQLIRHYIEEGHTHIRTHVNVDPVMKEKHMEKIVPLLKGYEDQITYEIVAFPQHGILRNGPEFIHVLEKAIELGATHIGGVDPAMVDRDVDGYYQVLFDLAEKYRLGIDIHLHDRNSLGLFEMNRLLDIVEEREFKMPITFSHAFALADIKEIELEKIAERFVKNRVLICSTIPIGDGPITIPVKRLSELGVKVSCVHDSLTDHWDPFGTGDTIQKLNQLTERFGFIDEMSLGQALKYATRGITPLNETGEQKWPKVGQPANALLVDAVSSAHLIARRGPISTVISRGTILVEKEIDLKGVYR
ncbi:amidohydrolase [Vagococcus silagei]|uniref:Deaminase n=1 Tax=Vagococcus silagei TaxID=2508885 RepID=A0A4S3B8A1_9ENTE|nr:amidohydrolase [Vagococcus silagei]THB61095.1 deaminase [Vagococcus silagei]